MSPPSTGSDYLFRPALDCVTAASVYGNPNYREFYSVWREERKRTTGTISISPLPNISTSDVSTAIVGWRDAHPPDICRGARLILLHFLPPLMHQCLELIGDLRVIVTQVLGLSRVLAEI